MNEEVNFCNQCGSKINLDAKFCSNCGCDLHNSSTKTPLDKTIKVEVTNATVEKGFETVGKGVKATGATLKKGFKATGKGLEKGFKTIEKTGKGITELVYILAPFAVLFVFFVLMVLINK